MLSYIIVSFLATAVALPIDFASDTLLQGPGTGGPPCAGGNQYKIVTDSCAEWMSFAKDGVISECPPTCMSALDKARSSCAYASTPSIKTSIDLYFPMCLSSFRTSTPTEAPTFGPSKAPTTSPTAATLTQSPSATPTVTPTSKPTTRPTDVPTKGPTLAPSLETTAAPTMPWCTKIGPADVILTFDASGSIQPADWDMFMTFADNLIESIPVSTTQVHLGLIQFATNASTANALTGDKNAVIQSRHQKMSSPLAKGRSFIDKAVNLASAEFDANGRVGVPKLLVILTDGIATDKQAAQNALIAAKARGV